MASSPVSTAREQKVRKIWGVSVQELVSENEVTLILVVLAGWMLLFMGLTDIGEAAAKLARSPSSRQWEEAKADVAKKKSHYASMGLYYFLTAGALLCLGVHLVYSSVARRRASLPFQAQGNLNALYVSTDHACSCQSCHEMSWVPAVLGARWGLCACAFADSIPDFLSIDAFTVVGFVFSSPLWFFRLLCRSFFSIWWVFRNEGGCLPARIRCAMKSDVWRGASSIPSGAGSAV